MKKLSQMTTAQRKVRVAKLIQNPGTRSKVPDQYLPPALRQQREMNARLNAPVVQGSSLTNRDVSRSATAGAEVKYGEPIRQGQSSIGQSEQAGKDMAGYFDDYQRKVAEAQGATAQIGKDTTAAISGLAGAFGTPDTAGLSAGNAADAGNAAAVRHAILSNLGAVQTAQAGNANTYANQMANVVVPGQKLSAQASAAGKTQSLREQLAGLLKEKGTYKQQLQSDAVADEGKNVLAQQALGLDITKAATDAAAGRATRRETRRSNVASETAATQEVNAYGYSKADWAAKTPAERQKIMKDVKNATKSKANNGVDWVTPTQQSTAQSQIEQAIGYAKSLKGDKYTRAQAVSALTSDQSARAVFDTVKDKKTGKTKQVRRLNPDGTQVTSGAWSGIDSALASAALDMAYVGHLSKYTTDKLHTAGIKVGALGLPTRGRRVVKAKLSPAQRTPGGT
jgi:hypothetical protein